MAAGIGAKAQADGQRHPVLLGQKGEIADAHDNIIFLKGYSVFGYAEKFPQILFGRLQPYHSNSSVWGSSDKILFWNGASGGHTGQKGSVAVSVCGRNQTQRSAGS